MRRWIICLLWLPQIGISGSAAAQTVSRFDRGTNPIALSGPARPQRYMEASGLRAAFLGREDGTFEAWVYPLKVLHGFEPKLQGRRGRTYRVRLRAPSNRVAIDGGTLRGTRDGWMEIDVTFQGERDWIEQALAVRSR